MHTSDKAPDTGTAEFSQVSDNLLDYRFSKVDSSYGKLESTIRIGADRREDFKFLDTAQNFPLPDAKADTRADARPDNMQLKSDEKPVRISESQAIQQLADFISSAVRIPGEANKASELVRNRFEEKIMYGGNWLSLERKINAALADQGLSVKFNPTAGTGSFRESSLAIYDTTRTRRNPEDLIIGYSIGRGMHR